MTIDDALSIYIDKINNHENIDYDYFQNNLNEEDFKELKELAQVIYILKHDFSDKFYLNQELIKKINNNKEQETKILLPNIIKKLSNVRVSLNINFIFFISVCLIDIFINCNKLSKINTIFFIIDAIGLVIINFTPIKDELKNSYSKLDLILSVITILLSIAVLATLIFFYILFWRINLWS